jgi:hypothetical protein
MAALQVLLLAIQRGEIPHELGVVGLGLEGVLDLADRFGQTLALLQDVGPLDARVDVVLRVDRDARELGEGTLVLAQLSVHGAEVVAHAPVLGLRRQHQVELGGSPLGVALLEIDEPDLGASLARIGVDALELTELRQRIVELLLPDVDAAETTAHEHALRVQGQNALVELDRLVGAPLQLVGEREVRQDELGLRIQPQRFQVVVLRLVELASGGVHATEIVVAEDRVRVARRETLQGGDGAIGFAALAVERAEEEVRILALGIDLQEPLVGRRGFVLAPEGRLDAGEESERVGIVGLCLDHEAHLLESTLELSAPHQKTRQAQSEEGRVGIGRDRLLEGFESGVRVVAGECHLAAEERPERSRVSRKLVRARRRRRRPRPGHPVAKSRAPTQQE